MEGEIKMKKKLLSLTAFLLLLVTLVFSASAANIKEFKSKSTFTPVTYSSHKATSEVTLYGNADYLCMKAYVDASGTDIFCLEIFSDSKRTKQILNYSNRFKKGTSYQDILFDLTSLKSKTYYATAYVMKESSLLGPYGYNLQQDPDTVKKFKITVKRDGTSIKNMKCIMYGYENTFYGPAIYWYSVPGATKYYVYKYTDSKYKKIATVDATDEEFSFYVDETLKSKNATRYYKVKAVKGSSATALSEKLKVVTLKAPTVKAELQSHGIEITWSKPKSGCTYTVYRAANDGEWERIATTGSRSYNDTNVKSGNAYYYAVVAQSGTTVSGYDPYGVGCYFMNAPYVYGVVQGDEALVVRWNDVSKAESYQVYRKLYKDTEWTLIGETSETSYIDGTAEKYTVYSYAVTSERNGYYSLYGKANNPAALFDIPVLNEIERNENGQPVLSWEKKDGVKYKIQRKEENGRWQVIDLVDGSSFVDTSIPDSDSKQYYYTIEPCIEYRSDSYIFGKGDETGTGFYYYAPIRNLSVTRTVSGVGFTWDEVKGVDGYNIYRKTAESEYELIGTSEKADFEDPEALIETRYTYKVAYCLNGEEKTDLAAETEVVLSAETVSFSSEPAVYYSDKGHWRIALEEFSADDKYIIYVRAGDGWDKVYTGTTSNGNLTISVDAAKVKNEYAVTAVKPDGTITALPEEGRVLDPVAFNPKLTIDQESFAAVISWDAVEGAEKFNIYDRDNKFITSVDGTKSSATIEKLETANTYGYIVGAVKDGAEVIIPAGEGYLYDPPTVKARIFEEIVLVDWDNDGFGSNYEIYRKDGADGEWKKIYEGSSSSSYRDRTVKDGNVYYYSMRVGDKSTGVFSAFAEKEAKVVYILPTEVTKVTTSKTSVKIQWKESSVADYYQIYRKESGGSWKLVHTTDSGDVTTYTDKKAKAGIVYYYSVRVCKDGERSEGAKGYALILAAPTNVKASKSGSNIKLTFTPSKGAAAHYIYRKTGNGSWKQIAKVGKSATSYTDKTAGSGTNYYYVQAISGGFKSPKSSTVSIKK